MEGWFWIIFPAILAAVFTIIVINFGIVKSVAPLAFATIVFLTISYPFYAFLVLNILKPVIDAYYELYIGPLKITQITSVYATLVWFFYIFVNRRLTKPITAFDYINILMLILIPAPLIFAPGMPTFESVFRLLSGWGFYWLARESNQSEEKAIETAFILSGIYPTITGILALMGFIQDAFHEEELRRLKAVYYDATAFGFELVPMWSILIYRLNKRISIPELVLFVLSTYLLYKTYTRALWTSAFLVLLITAIRGGNFSRWVLLGSAIFILRNMDEIVLRFSERGLGTDPESLNGRIQLWTIGLQRFMALDPIQRFFGVSIVGKPMGLFLHNLFLVFLFDYGILGAIVFSIWSAFVIYLLFRSKSEKIFYLTSAVVFSYVGGLTTSSFLYPNFQWFVMSSLGLLVKDHIGQFISKDFKITGSSKPQKAKSRNT
ncbi:MAG: hypothetical protein ABIL16_04715 [candidate division WOR-3 bacterium]